MIRVGRVFKETIQWYVAEFRMVCRIVQSGMLDCSMWNAEMFKVVCGLVNLEDYKAEVQARCGSPVSSVWALPKPGLLCGSGPTCPDICKSTDLALLP